MKLRRKFIALLLAFSLFPLAAWAQTGTALVRHAPALNGNVDGSIQQMLAESATLNGGATVTQDLLVPGTPTVRLNGNPHYAGTLDGTGGTSPSNYQITLNGNVTLRHVVRRTNAVALPSVAAPPSPAGTRTVTINSAGASPGSFSTLRNLTLNGNVGQFAVPAGTYGDFTANGGSGFTLGVAGATQPAVYHFQHLTFNGQTQLQVVGPVIITVASGFTGNGGMGSSAHAAWLTLNIYSGGFTLNGGCNLYGYVNAPNGTVIINGSSQLIGGVTCDRLIVNGNGLLRLAAATAGNTAPVANNQTVALNEDTPAPLTLTAIDADGNPLTYAVLTAPAHGTLSGTAPNLTYTPAANYDGADSFTFKASDGSADSNTATVTFAIAPVNDRPDADAKSVSLAEDSSANVILSGADADGNALTFSVASSPAHGALSGTAPNLIYTPVANFNGADSFTYLANDGSLNSLPATVSIVVTPVNDTPAANSATYSVNEGATLAVTLTGSDPDGDALAFTVLTQPTRGVLTGTPPNLSYLPAANFNGLDSFTFRAGDGSLNSAPATITIQVSNLNDPPVANPQSVTTAEDTAKAITLTGGDPDGDAITYLVVTPPTHGTLGGSAPNLTYTPAPDYTGTDSFTFKTRDTSSVDSNIATVSLTITPVNDAPGADDQTVATDEDTAVAIQLTGADVENSALTYGVVTPPQHGALSGTAPNLAYTPASDYNGPDSFTFKVNDGQLDSAVATVSLTVRPVNDAPVGAPQSLATAEDTPVALALTATDADSTGLTFAVATPPTHGTLTGAAPDLTYTPAADYNGADSFTFTANDGAADSAPVTISLNVTPVNDAPVATGQAFSEAQDTAVNFTLSATDVDGDTLTYTVVTPPVHGTLTGTAPNLTYTPVFNYRGADSLVFSASDGQAGSNHATISFELVAVSHAPVANDQGVALAEDSSANVALVATDLDGDALTYAIVTPPAHGSLSGAAPNLTYTPAANYHGTDAFAFKANDGSADSNTATVSLTITAVNDAPIASAESLTLAEDTPATVGLSALDVDGDALTYTIVTPPMHGTLSGTAPNLTYSPAANYHGPDSFTFTARDAALDSNLATVSLTVTAVNDAPAVAPQTLSTDEDTPLAVTLTGTDADSSTLTFAIVTPPTHGTLSGTAPNFTYRPATDYDGADSFTFKANDGALDSAPATVSLSITPVNDAPVANALTISTSTGTPTPITLTGSDVDSAALTFAVVTPPSHGTLTGTPPNLTYTSNASFGGFDSFAFKASDGALDSAPATIQVISGLPPRSHTYTTTADFAGGTLSSLSTDTPDQLTNQTILASYDVVWIANSSKGTVIKLDPETGRVLGEYLSAPDTVASPYPSRVAVDSKGNAWVANYSADSIVKIGQPENGYWQDRNNNNVADSSGSLGDIRSWPGAMDSVAAAADEAILLYVHTGVVGVRHLSVDADDNVWIGGPDGVWEKYDGRTGAFLLTRPTLNRGGLGGFVTADGKLYSAGGQFLIGQIGDPITALPAGDAIRPNTWASALDSKGNLWCTRDGTATVAEYSPTGELLGEFYHGEPYAMGIAIDANDHIWIAHSHCGHTVGHLLPDGTFLGNVEVTNHGPVEVSIDRHGRIWVASSTGVVDRINPLGGPLGSDGVTPVGEVDVKSGNLGGALWTYGRFTGSTSGLASPEGLWTNVYDGVLAGTTWGPAVWGGLLCNDAKIEVDAALSADGVNFGPFQQLTLTNPTPSGSGRYLKTRTRLVSATTGETPILYDLTVGTAGYTPPATAPAWFVSAGADIAGNWPDVVELKGAFCHSVHSFPTEPTYAWSVVSGPGTVTFADPAIKRPRTQFGAQGTYVLRLTATLGAEVSTDDVTIVLTPYNRAPYANAGYTTFIASFPPQIWLWGEVRDDGLPVGAAVTSTWSKLFGPGTVTFANPSAASTTASFSVPGVYTLQLGATDTLLTSANTTDVWIGVPPPPPVPDGLVSWWEASGNGDDHISGNQAFLERGAGYFNGKLGGAFLFNSASNRVRVFSAPGLDVGTKDGLTVELWVNPSAQRTATIFQYGLNNLSRGFQIGQADRAITANFRATNGTDHLLTTPNNALTVNTWTHVSASYDRASGEARIFVNGVLQAVQNLGPLTLATNYDIFMGGRADGTEPYQGLLDEISVYNRAIYADEVTSIVALGKRPPVSNLPPVVDAGPDRLINQHVGAAVSLAGVVTDDGQPTNGALSSLWSVVTGPGAVVFADANQSATTATFSVAGLYLLRLTADDGAFNSSDTVQVRVDALGTFALDPSLAAWWPANVDDRDVIHGLKVERFNGATFGPGVVEQAFTFDGGNDYGRTEPSPFINVGSSAAGATLEWWVKRTSANGGQMLAWENGVTLYAGDFLSGNLRDAAGVDHGFDTFYGGRVPLPANVWIHFALTYDRPTGEVRFYTNGVFRSGMNIGSAGLATSGRLFFGSGLGTGLFLTGMLDEVSLYTRPLTLAEVQAIYQAGASGKSPGGNQPPEANAGPDVQLLNASAAATLAGVVTDDGQPAGGVLTSTWSKVDGPGTVAFADDHAATTTATFSAPGVYVLRLDANDGLNLALPDTTTVRVGVSGGVAPPAGLAAWWPGNGELHEVVHGNHDIEFLPKGVSYGPGKVSEAFVFDGGSDYGVVPGHADLNVGTSAAGATLEWWVKRTSTNGGQMLAWENGVTLYAGDFLSGNLRDAAGVDHGFDTFYGGRVALPANVWTHFALTYNRPTGEVRFYTNGVFRSGMNIGSAGLATSGRLFFGSSLGTGLFLTGMLDEVSLYTRPLTLAEVQAIYQAGASGKSPGGNQPPEVNAGPDVQLLSVSGTATLAGTAVDDGQPAGGVLTSTWSKVDGPGTVAFADDHAPATTATFSAPGNYVLRLDANDGLNAAQADTVSVRVGVSGGVAPSAGLAAWWPGNGELHEVVHGNHDIEFLPKGVSYGTGQVSEAFVFDGGSDYGVVPGHADLNVGSSAAGATLEWWVKRTSANGGQMLAWENGVTLYAGDFLSGNLRDAAGVDHGFDTFYGGRVALPANVWTHFALTYDRPTGEVRFYTNGVFRSGMNIGAAGLATSGRLFFGSSLGTGLFLTGMLDEVSLYTRPLSDSEITAIYSAGASGKSPDGNQPPAVSAGPDVVLWNATDMATLSGTVTDDGKPAGGVVTSSWSKVQGPGSVTFADAGSPTTTATFGAPGIYVLRLDANDVLNVATGDTIIVRVAVAGAIAPPNSLAAWWPANGDTHEVMRGGHDFQFPVKGAQFTTGLVAQAYSFDGSGDYAVAPAHPDLDIGASPQGLTIEFWVKLTVAAHDAGYRLLQWSLPAQGGLGISCGQTGGGSPFFLVANLIDTSGSSHAITTGAQFALNTWTHVALTYDKSTGVGRLYQNGLLWREQNLGIFTPQTTLPLNLGRGTDIPAFSGALDEIGLYTRPLAQAEVQALYHAGAAGKTPDGNQAPVANAGPDVEVANASGPATLTGTVLDDGRPAGGVLTSMWSKVEGPGTVTFADATAAATTATFGAPGAYVLRLDAGDGELQAMGDTVTVRVGLTGAVAVPAGLAAWWPANGEVHEVVHGGHDVEFLPRGPSFGPGEQAQAFVFNGNDVTGRVAAHSDLDIGASAAGLTIEFWVNPSVADQWTTFLQWISADNQGGAGVLWAQYGYNSPYVLMGRLTDTSGQGHLFDTRTQLAAGVWSHVALTYDKTSGLARIFKNGAVATELNLGIFTPQTSYPLRFGCGVDSPLFAGALDEIGLYTRPLAPAEVQAIYTAGAAGKVPLTVNVPPTIVFASPASGDAFIVNTPITLGTLAADPDGTVAKVEYFDGLAKIGETTTAQSGQPLAFNFTAASGLALGHHPLTARVTDNAGGVATSGEVTINVVPVLPVVALTAPANNFSLPAGAPLTLGADATYTDGALARVEFFDGPLKLGESTVPAAGSSYTLVLPAGLTVGAHSLTAKAIAVAGFAATSAPISINVTTPQPPTIALTAPATGATLAANTAFTLTATAADADGTVAKVEFFNGTTKLGEDLTAPYSFTVAAGLPVGTASLRAKATDNTGLTTTSAPANVAFATYSGPPVAEIVAPAGDTRLSAPTVVTGVVAHSALASWALDYRLKATEGAAPEAWITLSTGANFVGTPANGSTPAVPGTLGTFDPTLLVNGIYELRLRVTDTTGSTLIDGPITLVVEGNMKIGAFTLAFEDLKLPVAGIPITVTRTYDSRDTRVGDFGPGWRLALANIRVQKNRNLGAGWYQTPQSGSGIQFYNVDPVGDRIVTVVFPDGETHRFKLGAYVKNRPGDPDDASFAVVVTQGQLRFYPLGDTTSKLEPLDSSNQLADHFFIAGTGDQDITAEDPGENPFAAPYNTTRFRLTTKDGTVYVLDEALGLLEMRDLNGNTLALNRDGANRVTSVVSTLNSQSSALSSAITIHRDGSGRIDYIRDPAGHDLDYLYDTSGRLASFTNRELNVTQFRYENASFPYYLTKIIDPRGVPAIRTEFDASGRMIKQIDADGKETVFTHQLTGASTFEKVKDRLGNETTFFYDPRGNVTLKIDPLGAQTSYSYYPDSDWVRFEVDHYGNTKAFAYDARGNVTVATLGALLTDDPANPSTGFVTRTSYNDFSAPTQITDPDHRVQTFVYDATTNDLLSQTLGAGGSAPSATTYTYNADGTPATTTDPLGNVTSTSYIYSFSDSNYPGAVKQVTTTVADPAGAAGSDPANATTTVLRTTRMLYDAQENQLAQIVSRHLPDGTAEDDITRYLYDSEQRLAATILPDGRVNETRYNSIGKEDKVVLWRTLADYQSHDDTLAHLTTYGYDSRGNQTSIGYADGTSESMHFDEENRKDWSQDRRGHKTTFQYDALGRLRFTIFPDATPVSLADNPRAETQYDLVGRVRFQIDERGSTTEFTYEDGCACAMRRHQMIQHRALGNLVTTYVYDNAGNVRFVTDARGNTVETRYDDQSRPTLIVYPPTDENPATQTETRYDLLGRRTAAVDQEGKITRYRYDALGRLLEVRQYLNAATAAADSDYSLPATHSSLLLTRYTYDEAGNQQTQADALGRTTTFWTDSVGRRTKRVLPKDAAESAALTETLNYDAWGNLWHRTDFAGKTTTFGYDTLNRLKSKTADATHPSLSYSHAIARIEYDYDENGARTAARTYNAGNTQLYTESTPRDERNRLDYKDTAAGRLDYSYYANNLLKDTISSNSGGLNAGYRYDEANRLESVDDTSIGLPTRTTGYTYNPNGSLETVTQPNSVTHTYAYDALNRLRGLVVTHGTAFLHTYEYKLNPSGHRRQTVEGAKTTTYTYDELYRLTKEAIVGDTHGNNGEVGYDLDKVGNRQARTSSVSSVPTVLNQTFNARDWLSGDTHTANGSTQVGRTVLGEPPVTDTYDFEEHLILRTKADGSTVNLSYDADGNRIAKNILDAAAAPVSSTTWLVDMNNLTGYARVVEERSQTANPASQITKVFTYGHALISQAVSVNGGSSTFNYYAFDGHGSIRELTDATGVMTDRYDYDAFGNLVFNSGTTANANRYCGEQFDADLGLYYLRARYLNPDSGRFWSQDTYEGSGSDPMSLHKYVYAHADPVGRIDPSGHLSRLDYALIGQWVHRFIGGHFVFQNPEFRRSDTPLYLIMQDFDPEAVIEEAIRPDLVDTKTREAYEIKPNRSGNGAAKALKQLNRYIETLSEYGQGLVPGTSYTPPAAIPPAPLYPKILISAERTQPGVILYTLQQKDDDGEGLKIAVAVTTASVASAQLYRLVSAAVAAQNAGLKGRVAQAAFTRF